MSRNRESSEDLFCYGTLLVPEIMMAICGRVIPGEEAFLENFKTRIVIGQQFPGMIPAFGESTSGKLFAVTSEELFLLNQYEGSLYRRQEVQARLRNGTQKICSAYLLKDPELLSEEHWSLELFEAKQKRNYLQNL